MSSPDLGQRPAGSRHRHQVWKVKPAALFFLILWVLAGPVTAEPTIEVRHSARSLQPGEVVLVSVWSPNQLDSLLASAFDREFLFYPVDGRTWEGLVGIDLDVEPGSYAVNLVGKSESLEVKTTYFLEVLPKEFPTRTLTVDPKFVTPPAEELDRIRRESRKVSGIFRRVTPDRFWQGFFLRPVPGEANSSFGKRSILNGQPRSPHTGTDFRGAEGTPIKSPNRGRVALADNLYYSGNTVIIDHGQGLYSYFAHLSQLNVAEGDVVERGDLIGLIGATGRVTGPHLHWTLRLAQTRVDPLSLMHVLDNGPVETSGE